MENQWHPTPVLLPGKSHGRRSLEGCSPWGRWGSDMTEQLHFHFSLLCIGEGNGNPLQCSCLENPRDRGAWWAAFYGVAQSQTRLKRLSSSSSSSSSMWNGHNCMVVWRFFGIAFLWDWSENWLVAQLMNPPAMQETWVWSLGWEDPLEEGMATHSSFLAWRILMNNRAWWATVHGVAKS